jgi:hypothetical protein
MEVRCNSHLAVGAAADMVVEEAMVPAHAIATLRPGTLGTAEVIRGTRIADIADGAAAAAVAARAVAAAAAAGVAGGPVLAQAIVGDKVQTQLKTQCWDVN